jgi:regulator of sigma E protease
MDLPSTITTPVAAALFILGFGFIIFVHELGHFLVAKWVGIKVTQFAIGMGHAVLSWRKGMGFRVGSSEAEYEKRIRDYAEAQHARSASPHDSADQVTLSETQKYEISKTIGVSETEYRLNWLPLGGYVKMVGQDDMDPTALSDDPRAFNRKPIWARMAVVSAGVIMNGIFAIIFFLVAFLHGVEFPPAEIGPVSPGSPAAKTAAADHPDVVGLQTGDKLVLINDKKPSDFTDMMIASALAAPCSKIDLVVERPQLEGRPRKLHFVLPTEISPDSGLQYVGVFPPLSLQVIRADNDEVKAQLAAKGLKPQLYLTHINGQRVEHYWEYHRAIEQAHGKPLQLTFSDTRTPNPKQTVEITYKPQTMLASEDDKPNLAGIEFVAQVRDVLAGGSAKDKLQAGDVIASVGDVKYPTMSQFIETTNSSANKELAITVLRDGKSVDLKLTPNRKGKIGAMLQLSPFIAKVSEKSPFAPLNLKPGTRIVEAGGRPIATVTDLRIALEDAKVGNLKLTYHLPLAGGLTETKDVAISDEVAKSIASLGWDEDMMMFQMRRELQQAADVGSAISMGVDKTKNFMLQTYITLARLFQGTVKVGHLRGPIGIVTEGSRFTEKGWAYLMFFLGLISISVAVFNFLPMPIVDGGLAVLLIIEKLHGKPVPPQVASAINMVGLALLGSLFLTTTFNDIVRELFSK